MAPGFLRRLLFPAGGTAEAPPPDGQLRYMDDSGAPFLDSHVLISALGPDLPARGDQVRMAAAVVRRKRQRPVIAATDIDAAFLVASDGPIEMLPRRADLAVLDDAEYAAYLRRRWDVILAKWDIRAEIALGQEFDAFLAAECGRPAG